MPLDTDFQPGWVHEWREADGTPVLQLAHSANPSGAHDGCLLRAPTLCDFRIHPHAGTIDVDPHGDLDAHTLEHLLIDQALPRLLAGRGHLVAHASQVRIGSESALFLGRSGWGKSTLAGLLHQRGHPALCDDCVLLEVRDGQAFATPSYPGLRLYHDSIAQVAATIGALSPVSDYSDKQRVIGLMLPPEALEARPVRAIYVLSDPALADAAMQVEPRLPADACMALVEHGFRLDPSANAETVQLLRQAAEFTRAAPAFSLQFPHDFDRQEELLGMLLDHFDSLTHPAP